MLAAQGLPSGTFGEGATAVGDAAWVLTWRAGRALVFDTATLAPKVEHRYEGQGWGLTFDGVRLIQSDGSDRLVFRHPVTFAEVGAVSVTDRRLPLKRINELEWVRGRVLANVWQRDQVAVIDPADGLVTGWYDFSSLAREIAPADPGAVLNGLAWDGEFLYATGKLWPTLFKLRLKACPAFAD